VAEARSVRLGIGEEPRQRVIAPISMQPATTVRRTNLSRVSCSVPLVLRAFIWSVILFALTVNCSAQGVAADLQQKEVVLKELYRPVYPAIARLGRITGDVDLTLNVRQDGSVESVVVISGHPLLQNAALNSARQSRFECWNCSAAVTPYRLVYTFQLAVLTVHCNPGPKDCKEPTPDVPPPQVTQLPNHVTILNHVLDACICDVLPRRHRSLKCVYLWRCGPR
jgi:TonB family protein